MEHTKRHPAAFLDRDGVLNVDHGYVHKAEDFQWIPGALESIVRLYHLGFYVFVVTNQSGIGRHLYSEQDFLTLTRWMEAEVKAAGGCIHETFFCPHHPTQAFGSFRIACACRKPGIGMLKTALHKWPMIKEGSFMVGDKASDIACAENFGIRGLLFPGGNLLNFLKESGVIDGETSLQ